MKSSPPRHPAVTRYSAALGGGARGAEPGANRRTGAARLRLGGLRRSDRLRWSRGSPCRHLRGNSFKAPAEHSAQRTRRRGALAEWARENDRLIVEDDYNGELRYLARPIPAMQPLAPENVVYIGSFSQLLLPSVRVAYMALPARLAESCAAAAGFYDPTSSKIEQLALAEYIREGHLERHLRRAGDILRKAASLEALVHLQRRVE
ncbi:MAG: hypothetical protein ACLUEQ_04805 [Cloacibacillus evryensis]